MDLSWSSGHATYLHKNLVTHPLTPLPMEKIGTSQLGLHSSL